jgi:cytochrome c oxidase cbb3-type subunit 3
LWSFYACIVWAIGYWIVYPAWPLLTNSTQGITGWYARNAIVADLADLKTQRGPLMDNLGSASLMEIADSPQLLDFARAQGRVAFADNCAPCHGAGGGGFKGYRTSTTTTGCGAASSTSARPSASARSGTTRRAGQHAAVHRCAEAERDFGRCRLRPLFVRLADGKGCRSGAGQKVFADNCAVCHGEAGKGNRTQRAHLTDRSGSMPPTRRRSYRASGRRGGIMPIWKAAWANR